jgi:hypothetical protein
LRRKRCASQPLGQSPARDRGGERHWGADREPENERAAQEQLLSRGQGRLGNQYREARGDTRGRNGGNDLDQG